MLSGPNVSFFLNEEIETRGERRSFNCILICCFPTHAGGRGQDVMGWEMGRGIIRHSDFKFFSSRRQI